MKHPLVTLALIPLLTAGCATLDPSTRPEAVRHAQDSFHIGFAGFTFVRVGLDKAVDTLRELDVHYLCVKDFFLPFKASDGEIASFKKRMADAKITPYAIGPIYSSTKEEIDRDFAFAQKLGVNLIVGVPVSYKDGVKDWSKQEPNAPLIDYVEQKVKETGIRYAIHNHGPDGAPYATANELWGYIKDKDARIGFCLDIGHNARSNEDPWTAIRLYHDRIFDIHWKNITAFDKSGHSLPASRGELDYTQFVKALREVGYTGVLALEYEADMDDPYRGIAESVGYLRGILDATAR
ncbi:MAG: sugar phosphate isomerase/epimerase family protein [Kiritimatiellia bacterium]